MDNGPNLLRVSEKGWDKRALDFELVVLEVVVTVLGQNGAASDGLVVVRGVLRLPIDVVFPESGVVLLLFGD